MKRVELKIVYQYFASGEVLESILLESFRIYLYCELQQFASGQDYHALCS